MTNGDPVYKRLDELLGPVVEKPSGLRYISADQVMRAVIKTITRLPYVSTGSEYEVTAIGVVKALIAADQLLAKPRACSVPAKKRAKQ